MRETTGSGQPGPIAVAAGRHQIPVPAGLRRGQSPWTGWERSKAVRSGGIIHRVGGKAGADGPYVCQPKSDPLDNRKMYHLTPLAVL
jgi:hypothetical protein